jgi:hypothetical protein
MGTVGTLTNAQQEFCDRYIQREYNARLALHAAGLKLERNHPDDWTHRTFGRLYHIRRGNQVIEGASQVEYEMTLEQVENYIKHTTAAVTFTVEEIADIAQSLIQKGETTAALDWFNKELSDEIGCAGALLEKLLADGVINKPVTLPAA